MKIVGEKQLCKTFRAANNRLKTAKICALVLFVIAVFGFNACRQNVEVSRADQQTTNRQTIVIENKTSPAPTVAENIEPPKVFVSLCAECHGDKGEGTDKHPPLKGVTTRTDDPLSDEKLLAIINDAKSQGLSDDMPSFRKKLSEAEKQEIIRWLKTLKE